MKLWIDDVRPAPNLGYFAMPSVNLGKAYIEYCEKNDIILELIDIEFGSLLAEEKSRCRQ